MSDTCGMDEDALAQRIWQVATTSNDVWYPPSEKDLWIGYAVLVLTKGVTTTADDVPNPEHLAAIRTVAASVTGES